jgi:hypothetical protein
MLRMCVYMHSRFVENHPIRILKDGPLISEVILSHPSSILHFPLIASPGLQLCRSINYSSSQHYTLKPGYKSPKSYKWSLSLDFYRISIH